MEIKIGIGISNRHVHLTKETYDKLFDTPLEMVKPLNQIGEFVSNQVVTLRQNGFEIASVKVLGPLRKYDQVEISRKDALSFKMAPPVRASGNLDGASEMEIIGPKGSVVLPVAIIAQRHVHMTPDQAKKLGIKNGDKLALKINGEKSGIMDIYAKVSENGYFEAHLDSDDANAFLLNKEDEGILIL